MQWPHYRRVGFAHSHDGGVCTTTPLLLCTGWWTRATYTKRCNTMLRHPLRDGKDNNSHLPQRKVPTAASHHYSRGPVCMGCRARRGTVQRQRTPRDRTLTSAVLCSVRGQDAWTRAKQRQYADLTKAAQSEAYSASEHGCDGLYHQHPFHTSKARVGGTKFDSLFVSSLSQNG